MGAAMRSEALAATDASDKRAAFSASSGGSVARAVANRCTQVDSSTGQDASGPRRVMTEVRPIRARAFERALALAVVASR